MKRPLRPYSYPGCSTLVVSGRCEKHKAKDQEKVRRYNRARYAEYQHLYGNEWKKARKAWLMEHPLCVECQKQGKVVPATVVDHIKPHKGDVGLFWDRGNWQSLCWSCNSRKAARDEGGFGNKPSDKPSKACGADGRPTDGRHHWNR